MVNISKEKIMELEKVLTNYSGILSEFEIKDQIVNTFKFEKPLTSIEIDTKDTDKIEEFMEKMEEFFFVGHTYFEPDSEEFRFFGLVFLSRFRNLFDVVMNYANKHNGLLDEFADLSGILFGYSSKEVAKYCLKDRLRNFKLIK